MSNQTFLAHVKVWQRRMQGHHKGPNSMKVETSKFSRSQPSYPLPIKKEQNMAKKQNGEHGNSTFPLSGCCRSTAYEEVYHRVIQTLVMPLALPVCLPNQTHFQGISAIAGYQSLSITQELRSTCGWIWMTQRKRI